jgi:hypothetical protein
VTLSQQSVIWLVAYCAIMALVVGGLLRARSSTLAMYGTPQAQAEWDQWREAAKDLAQEGGPIARRVPTRAEPPALLLMRDHFVACLATSVLLTSVLFGTFMVFVRGALAPGNQFVDRSEPEGQRTPS